MAYEVVMPYHLHMPSYFLETFTEYPRRILMLISSLSISKRENTSSPGARKYATSIIWNPASSGYGFRTKRIERFQHGLSKPKSSSIFSFHMKNTMPTTISRHWSHARSGDCPKKIFISYMSYPSISTSWPEYIW